VSTQTGVTELTTAQLYDGDDDCIECCIRRLSVRGLDFRRGDDGRIPVSFGKDGDEDVCIRRCLLLALGFGRYQISSRLVGEIDWRSEKRNLFSSGRLLRGSYPLWAVLPSPSQKPSAVAPELH
jgi:hypothetical protein